MCCCSHNHHKPDAATCCTRLQSNPDAATCRTCSHSNNTGNAVNGGILRVLAKNRNESQHKTTLYSLITLKTEVNQLFASLSNYQIRRVTRVYSRHTHFRHAHSGRRNIQLTVTQKRDDGKCTIVFRHQPPTEIHKHSQHTPHIFIHINW